MQQRQSTFISGKLPVHALLGTKLQQLCSDYSALSITHVQAYMHITHGMHSKHCILEVASARLNFNGQIAEA